MPTGPGATQRGVGVSTAAQLALTGAALAVTAYSRMQGKKLQDAGMVPVHGATEPSADTPADVAKAQQQLKVCQWAIPASPPVLPCSTSWKASSSAPAR